MVEKNTDWNREKGRYKVKIFKLAGQTIWIRENLGLGLIKPWVSITTLNTCVETSYIGVQNGFFESGKC